MDIINNQDQRLKTRKIIYPLKIRRHRYYTSTQKISYKPKVYLYTPAVSTQKLLKKSRKVKPQQKMDNHNSLHLRMGSRTDTPRSGREQQGAEASLFVDNLLRFSGSNRALHTRSSQSYFYTYYTYITDWQVSRMEREQQQGQNTETSSIKRGSTMPPHPPSPVLPSRQYQQQNKEAHYILSALANIALANHRYPRAGLVWWGRRSGFECAPD